MACLPSVDRGLETFVTLVGRRKLYGTRAKAFGTPNIGSERALQHQFSKKCFNVSEVTRDTFKNVLKKEKGR